MLAVIVAVPETRERLVVEPISFKNVHRLRGSRRSDAPGEGILVARDSFFLSKWRVFVLAYLEETSRYKSTKKINKRPEEFQK